MVKFKINGNVSLSFKVVQVLAKYEFVCGGSQNMKWVGRSLVSSTITNPLKECGFGSWNCSKVAFGDRSFDVHFDCKRCWKKVLPWFFTYRRRIKSRPSQRPIFNNWPKVFIHTLLNHINAVITIYDDRHGINFSFFFVIAGYFFDPLLLIDVSKSSQSHDLPNQGHIFLAVGSALKKVIQQQLEVQEHVILQKVTLFRRFLEIRWLLGKKKGACYQILPTLILERNDTLLFQTYLTDGRST